MKKIVYLLTCIMLLFIACKSESGREPAAQTSQFNAKDTLITFENSKVGKFPSGWSAETGKWTIARDADDTALKMETNDGSSFNIAVLKGSCDQNFEIEVRIKSLAGEEDQGGGLVWRYIDANNYYIVRANPLENNIRFYKVVDGRRKLLESVDIRMRTLEWFTIKVIVIDNNVECFYNGIQAFKADDDTFAKPGFTGFWSKADAVSLFDNLKIKVLK